MIGSKIKISKFGQGAFVAMEDYKGDWHRFAVATVEEALYKTLRLRHDWEKSSIDAVMGEFLKYLPNTLPRGCSYGDRGNRVCFACNRKG